MVLSISLIERVISIPGCLPVGVGHNSNHSLLRGGQKLFYRSVVCTL